MSNFATAIEKTLGHEGGYVNNPNDKGGETNWGITTKVAKANGYEGKMKELPLAYAKVIYKKEYWDKLKLDSVNNQVIAEIAFDIGVNAGIGTAAKMLQEMINFMTTENIMVDGKIGPVTLGRLNAIQTKRDNEEAVLLLSILQGEHYLNCMRKREANEEFSLGWLRRARNNIERSKL